MEPGETPWEGVIHETREETGFEIVVERLAGIYSWAPREDENTFRVVCRVSGGERTTTDESDGVRSFTPNNLPSNTFPEHVHRINDALRGEPQTLLKTTEGPSSRDVARGIL